MKKKKRKILRKRTETKREFESNWWRSSLNFPKGSKRLRKKLK